MRETEHLRLTRALDILDRYHNAPGTIEAERSFCEGAFWPPYANPSDPIVRKRVR